MPDHIECFLKINGNMVQVASVLQVFFRKYLEAKYLFNGASVSSESCLIFSKNFFHLRLQPVKQGFQYDFAGMAY